MEAQECTYMLFKAAIMSGSRLVSLEHFLSAGSKGAAVAFKPAVGISRRVFMRNCFLEDGPENLEEILPEQGAATPWSATAVAIPPGQFLKH